MIIMVFDVPAECGGALTILKQYYQKAIKDRQNQWFFVISTPELAETENVKVLRYPWIKKSWFHRFYFDKFIAHKIVEKYKADEVLSLQNIVVPNLSVKQVLYLHQPLPFVEKRYRITENFKFWIYQNVISKMILNSIMKADSVIVQTKWMKEACLKKIGVDSDRFKVEQPEINIEVKKSYKQEDNDNVTFFYPSSGLIYKNHKIIVDALKILGGERTKNIKVVFTLKGHENNNVKKMYKIVKDNSLPIDFIGQIDIDEVYEYYSKSILLFPSYIETFGLPMLEAKIHGAPILASNCSFSKEILDDYDRAIFFDPFDAKNLADMMTTTILGGKYDLYSE